MNPRDILLERADEYAIRKAHQAEIAETGDREAALAARDFAVAEMVLREVADALEEAA